MLNLDYLPVAGTIEHGHTTPTEEMCNVWKDIKARTQFKNFFEIGQWCGHSAATILELFDDVHVTSLDIAHTRWIKKASFILKEKFGDRFDYIHKSSSEYFASKPKIKDYDIVFIDGDHHYGNVLNDLNLAKYLNPRYILLDDVNIEMPDGGYTVRKAFEEVKHEFKVLEQYRYQTLGEPVLAYLLVSKLR